MFFDKRVRSSMSRTAITLKFKMSRLLEKPKNNNNSNNNNNNDSNNDKG